MRNWEMQVEEFVYKCSCFHSFFKFQLITDCVYDLLEEKGLHKIKVPLDAEGDSGTFIFSTQKELKEPKKLLILIHGSGVVRAGQWARSLIINHSIDAGTQIPYIEEAKKQGFEVILTNTNDNYSEEGMAFHPKR